MPPDPQQAWHLLGTINKMVHLHMPRSCTDTEFEELCWTSCHIKLHLSTGETLIIPYWFIGTATLEYSPDFYSFTRQIRIWQFSQLCFLSNSGTQNSQGKSTWNLSILIICLQLLTLQLFFKRRNSMVSFVTMQKSKPTASIWALQGINCIQLNHIQSARVLAPFLFATEPTAQYNW